MNLLLLEQHDFISPHRARLSGRRLDHVRKVHKAAEGDSLRVGVVGGNMGAGRIDELTDAVLELTVSLDAEPPPKLPVQLILALPRPKVLNRTIAAAVSMGIREIDLINAWRVEKAYWQSPYLSEENLRMQCMLGLEQAGDTVLPQIRLHRLFTPYVREQLPNTIRGQTALVAHPRATMSCPTRLTQPLVLAIGPEGGFIEREVKTFKDIGFEAVSLGSRILRVETALPYLLGTLGVATFSRSSSPSA